MRAIETTQKIKKWVKKSLEKSKSQHHSKKAQKRSGENLQKKSHTFTIIASHSKAIKTVAGEDGTQNIKNYFCKFHGAYSAAVKCTECKLINLKNNFKNVMQKFSHPLD